MDGLVLLVGAVLSRLRGALGTDVCPGEWAWATTALGILVGLLPAVTAIAVARLRYRAGGAVLVPAVALLGCGLLPWLVFAATGRLFAGAAAGAAVGLDRVDRLSLTTRVCLGATQQAYLGAGSVSGVLSGGSVRTALLFTPLVVFPLILLGLVWLQGRVALRKGPRWPSRFLWLPVLVLALATTRMPAGSTAQLWIGLVLGSVGGLVVVGLVRPARASRATPGPGRQAASPARPARPAGPGGPVPAGPGSGPGAGPPRSFPRPRTAPAAVPPPPSRPAAPSRPASAPVPAASAPAGPGAADRLRTGLERARHWLEGAPGRMSARMATPAPVQPAPGGAAAGGGATSSGAAGSGAAGNGATGSGATGSGAGKAAAAGAAAAGGLAGAGGVAAARAGQGAAPSVPKPRPPRTLVAPPTTGDARYELIHQIGAGGFGGVWLAHDHVRGHRVALKAAHAPDKDTEERIRREARALGAVRHPHCVRIFELVDSRSDPGLSRFHGLVIVMAYLEGCSLDELVRRRGPLDDVTAARTWSGLADALGAAHRHGVLHRDVKPGNVLVDPASRPHLIDFGIARARGDVTLTLHGFVLGTPDYLAPEVARGGSATPASDSWQLAATMSFALTGWPPRGGHEDAASGLRAAASGAAPSHLPTAGAHTELLRACLAESPASRPSLDTTRAALERWLAAAAPRSGARR